LNRRVDTADAAGPFPSPPCGAAAPLLARAVARLYDWEPL
jgi:hypothetical protein